MSGHESAKPRNRTLANSPVYTSFKFLNSSAEMGGPKGNKRTGSQFHRMRKEGNESQDHSIAHSIGLLESEDGLLESEQREGRRKIYIKQRFMDSNMPEMTALFHDSKYSFVNSILLDSESHPEDGDCDGRESPEDNLDIVSSSSDESKVLEEESDCENEVIKQSDSKNVMHNEEEFEQKDFILTGPALENMIHQPLLPKEVQRYESDSSNSLVSSADKVVEDKASIRAESTLEQEDGMPGNNIIHSNRQECCSTRAEWSGSISERCSSTASSHSFAFPILQSEWKGSPVRMPKTGRKLSQTQTHWRMNCFCRKF